MKTMRNKVFTLVKNAVTNIESNAYVTSEYVPIPPNFPCVSVLEINNIPFKQATDLNHKENLTRCEFQIEVFTDGDEKITDNAKIVSAIDTALNGIGFQRSFYQNIPNVANYTIWRATLRYYLIF